VVRFYASRCGDHLCEC